MFADKVVFFVAWGALGRGRRLSLIEKARLGVEMRVFMSLFG